MWADFLVSEYSNENIEGIKRCKFCAALNPTNRRNFLAFLDEKPIPIAQNVIELIKILESYGQIR